MDKLVSVIITSCDRIDLFKLALNSVLKQSYENYEIIVIDSSLDLSVKNHVKNLKSIKYQHFNNNNANYLRNKGVELCNGELIAFLDDDDIWNEEKLQYQVDLFNRHNIQLCYTGKNIKYEKVGLEKYSFKKPKFSNIFNSILWDNFIGTTSSIMVQSCVFKLVGNFDESLPALQDYDFYIRVCKKFNVKGIDKCLVIYRSNHSANQISLNKEKFKKAKDLLKSKYNYKLLRFSLFKIGFKKRLKKLL